MVEPCTFLLALFKKIKMGFNKIVKKVHDI